MKKALFMLVAGSVLAGSVFAQTAAPAVNATTNAVTKAAAAVPVAASAVKSVAAEVKAVVAPTAAASTAAAPVAASAPAAPAKAAAATPAVGAGPGKVWVNGKVYHCAGTKFYGKTKAGAYMTEAEAKAKGAHVVKGQVCK